MIGQRITAAIVLFFCLGLAGCGGLRFSETAPEARDFRPGRIALLPADTRAFMEAKGVIDRFVSEAISERGWFATVVGGEAVARRMEADEPLRAAVGGYLAKRENVSFSDPALSGRIGELTGTEALLLVRVDSWNYTIANDKKLARVGLSFTLVDAKTGKDLWTAAHHRLSEYLILRPELASLAKDLAREMIGHMPR